MTLSTQLKESVIRHELEQAWKEYEPILRCYANVASYYMNEKSKVMGKSFNSSTAAILAAEIAWWVHESCLKKRHKP